MHSSCNESISATLQELVITCTASRILKSMLWLKAALTAEAKLGSGDEEEHWEVLQRYLISKESFNNSTSGLKIVVVELNAVM